MVVPENLLIGFTSIMSLSVVEMLKNYGPKPTNPSLKTLQIIIIRTQYARTDSSRKSIHTLFRPRFTSKY